MTRTSIIGTLAIATLAGPGLACSLDMRTLQVGVGDGSASSDARSCTPPATPIIMGQPDSPAQIARAFHFAAPGLTPPTITKASSADTFTITANPGIPSDAANAWGGIAVNFTQPPCIDASSFSGVSLTLTGDLGTCM